MATVIDREALIEGPAWESIHSSKSWGRWPNEALVRFICTRRPGRVLELGCGQGANLVMMSKEGCEVYGLDISKSAVMKARENLQHFCAYANVQVGDVRELKDNRLTFDAVVDVACLMHLDEEGAKRTVAHVHKMLRPGGFFFLSEIVARDSQYQPEPGIFLRPYSSQELSRLLFAFPELDIGFEIRSVDGLEYKRWTVLAQKELS